MADSQAIVKALLEVDPQFSALCDTLFGPSVDPAEVWSFLYTREGVAKMNPAPSDLASLGDTARTASGVRSGRLVRRRKQVVKSTDWLGELLDSPAKAVRAVRAAPAAGARGARKYGPPVAVGAAGGVIANQLPQNQKDSRRLGRRKPSITDPSGKKIKFDSATERNTAYLVMRDQAKLSNKPVVGKSAGVTWDVEFSKVDDEKRQVFGWASIVELDGSPVVDRQGDWIAPEEIEKAAYAYVEKSRKGGHQHRRTETDEPFHASDMIESIVFTDEKVAKMGLPDDFPRGWWVGYQVRDEDTWQKVKKGEVTGFSIHGRGRRQEVPA